MRKALGSLAAREEDKASMPDFPTALGDIYVRLSGYSGEVDRVVRCEEAADIIAKVKEYTGSNPLPPVSQWHNILQGRWNPPKFAHFVIDIEAPTRDILKRVESVVDSLRILRIRMGFTSYKSDEKRYHFDDDDENFRVYDLFQPPEDKTADEIIKIMWPEEYKNLGGRNTETSDKGPLIQRAYDKRDSVKEWINYYTGIIRHSIKI